MTGGVMSAYTEFTAIVIHIAVKTEINFLFVVFYGVSFYILFVSTLPI